MTIQIITHIYRFTCDQCATTHQCFAPNLNEAWHKARKHGWRHQYGHTYCSKQCAQTLTLL
ncbi:hypothetical protein BBIA_1863 [Bifidobacterium biavatii DSM 23969]|uniref:Uncharacterized protein n=1 Tax=Bifidobacterium biavatii DSM 23969 TaxID=1437608 RepID=A0A086ZTU1_9BIFI|nr:hypothetical protein BBIA_1863 [Bifidobacterium biavatii DSM 23969]